MCIRDSLYTEEDYEVEMGTVPNVIGMTPANANATLINAGFNIRIVGSGTTDTTAKASKQSVEEGVKLEKGTVVEVEFYSEIAIN